MQPLIHTVYAYHFLDKKQFNKVPLTVTQSVQITYIQWSISLAPASDIVWFAPVLSSANRTWPAPLRFSVADAPRSSVWH